MTRRTIDHPVPARAPLEQPPLFYRNGRALTDRERGIVKPKPPQLDVEPVIPPREPFADCTPTPLFPVVLLGIAVAVGVVAMLVLRLSVVGLFMALGMFGAMAKVR